MSTPGRHDYEPDDTKIGNACTVCGFGQYHAWHEPGEGAES